MVWTPERRCTVGLGDLAVLPKDVPPTWCADDGASVQFAAIVAPSGFERFLGRILEEPLAIEDIDGRTKLAADMGIEMIGPVPSDDDVAAILRGEPV